MNSQTSIFQEKRMAFQQPGQNLIEKIKAGVKEIASNLSETAQLVYKMMSDWIMPVLRQEGLVKKANEIFEKKLKADDPQVLEFSLACRDRQSEIYEKAKADGLSEKQLAVISNYFSKLINAVNNTNLEEVEKAVVEKMSS